MPTYTPNYNLQKPTKATDNADIDVINNNMEVIDSTMKGLNDKATGAADGLVSHLADYTLQVPYAGTTTGIANVYKITTPVITTLTAGMAVSVKFNINSTGESTLNWCGLGAKGIKKADGNNVTNLKANGIYTLRYDGVNFILQGEGASGNATVSDLLSGKTATTDAGEITGTMPNRGSIGTPTLTSQNQEYVVQSGYHNGTGKVKATFANLIAGNVKSGVTIGGVIGTFIGGSTNLFPSFEQGYWDTSNTTGTITSSGLNSISLNLHVTISLPREIGIVIPKAIDLSSFNIVRVTWSGVGGVEAYAPDFTAVLAISTNKTGASSIFNARTTRVGTTGNYFNLVDSVDVSSLSGSFFIRVHNLKHSTWSGLNNTLTIHKIELL